MAPAKTEPTVMIDLGDREIEMRKPTDGALVVLARTFKGLPKIKNVEELAEIPPEMRERLIRDLGTLGRVVEAMIVNEDDKDWLDTAMIDGTVTAEDVFEVIRRAGEKFNGTTTKPAKAPAPVRRSRAR